ncbi:hypothetical protein LSAT2_008724 [Lamellibrachia satsuma]|nr:hypothetical protein LSAT2_008724 [Lamellibrachia satsuma]
MVQTFNIHEEIDCFASMHLDEADIKQLVPKMGTTTKYGTALAPVTSPATLHVTVTSSSPAFTSPSPKINKQIK